MVISGLLGLPLAVLLDVFVGSLPTEIVDRLNQFLGIGIFVLYSTLATLIRSTTLGKGMTRLGVVAVDTGGPPTDRQILYRFIVLGLSLLACVGLLPLVAPPFLVVGTLAALVAPVAVRPDGRALHDLIAGTMVVVLPPETPEA